MASPSGEAQTVKKLHSCLFACVGATIGRPSACRSNAFSGSLGFPLGGSCQRPRPLTDEGEVLGAVPQTGSRRTPAPHPACGHLPPRGKAPSGRLQDTRPSSGLRPPSPKGEGSKRAAAGHLPLIRPAATFPQGGRLQTGGSGTPASHPALRAAFPRRGRLLRMIKRGSPN